MLVMMAMAIDFIVLNYGDAQCFCGVSVIMIT